MKRILKGTPGQREGTQGRTNFPEAGVWTWLKVVAYQIAEKFAGLFGPELVYSGPAGGSIPDTGEPG